jgi:hypothetical protein
MILQLPNGRIIELSVEEYLDMSEQDLRDLNSLGNLYTKDYVNPFYGLYSSNTKRTALEDIGKEEENFLTDDEIDLLSNRIDLYYFPEEGDLF